MAHTLIHSPFHIEDIVNYNLECHHIMLYDGSVIGLFCQNKNIVFIRKLLDKWLWDFCETGGTFMDLFML